MARALAYMARIRELPAKHPVLGRVISRETMIGYVKRELDTEVPPAVVDATREILVEFGTVPDDFDYRTSLLDMLQAALLGFYDPKEKTMFLSADLGGPERDATLFHELVHALQDQYYGLENLLAYTPDASDFQSAVHALAEGDATSAMIDALFADKGVRAPDIPPGQLDMKSALSMTGLEHVPQIIQRSVLEPYFDGLAFVNALRRQGGWAAVDAAWKRLPATTEQLLHIQKYLSNEAAEEIPTPPSPSAGTWQATYTDVLGEQTVRILLEEWMPEQDAAEAASGWAGDHIAVFAAGDRRAVGWRVRFDDIASSKRALRAISRGALSLQGSGPAERGQVPPDTDRVVQSGQVCRGRHTRGVFAVARHERDLGVALGSFGRNPAASKSDEGCKEALAWANQISQKSR